MKKDNKGIVSIHGRQYKTVVMRVNEFRTTSAFDRDWETIHFI